MGKKDKKQLICFSGGQNELIKLSIVL